MAARRVAWVLVMAAACAGRGPRDVGNDNPRSVFQDDPGGNAPRRDTHALDAGRADVAARPTASGRKPSELTRAESRALALGGGDLFFGDASDDGLYAIPKGGGPRRHVARRAPMPNALAFDSDTSSVAWIGTPGDVVFRLGVSPGASGSGPTTVRDRSVFTDVAADHGDVFFSEAHGTGGEIGRVTGHVAAHLATVDGTPRGIVVDGDDVYVATTTKLVAVPRRRGEVVELAAGVGFASPVLDGEWLYATVTRGPGRPRAIVRVRKTGGPTSATGREKSPLETVTSDVRDAPIASHHGTIFWFDAARPALYASSRGAPPTLLSEEAVFEHPSALAVDAEAAFVAGGTADDAVIVRVALP